MREAEVWAWESRPRWYLPWWEWKSRLVKTTALCKVHVSDPRAESKVQIQSVLDAVETQRFVHRLQHRKKEKRIGMVYTTVDLSALEQGCAVTIKSASTPQTESEMIRYFGKDLLISGFLRQFSHDTVYDDIEVLCLKFYHLHGATHQYERKYTRNEWLQCFKY